MTQHPETIPTRWTTADDDFFRTTWDAFSIEFLAGAGVLLASYDAEGIPAPDVAAQPVTGAPAVAATSRVTT